MKRILPFLLLFICTLCIAQNYTYIGVENGLSNRRVYSIEKDEIGYMWFLTHDGIDRFDGRNIKHYKLGNNRDQNSFVNLNKLHTDSLGNIWEISRAGQIFKYNRIIDKFELIKSLNTNKSDNDQLFNYTHIDKNNNIWLCTTTRQYIYNIDKNEFNQLQSGIKNEVVSIIHLKNDIYCIGSSQNIHLARLTGTNLQIIPERSLDSLSIQVSTSYYDKKRKKIIIGCLAKGIFVYDLVKHKITHLKSGLEDVKINCIKTFNEDEVLIGTDGAGIYKINLRTNESVPYIVADYNQPNRMNGNNIVDIYIDDEEQRIWMINYPIGITILNNRFPEFKWIKHAIGNKNSLINDQVNTVIEDYEGDLWFATNNGISCYNVAKDEWTNMLSSYNSDTYNKNHVFISICEVLPGIIFAGGYTSGMYWINKRDMKPNYFVPGKIYAEGNTKADKYIRAIYNDSQNRIWIGGYYYLKYIDINKKEIKVYPNIRYISVIIEKDSNHIWVGNINGLYLVNIKTQKHKRIQLPVESCNINVIHKEKDGTLYIGTNGSGLIIYNPTNGKATIHNQSNSALISNSIYSIQPRDSNFLVLSTENSLTRFNIEEKKFQNWTKEQGLITNHFNIASGTTTKRNTFVFGSGNGAIEFKKEVELPQTSKTKLIFSDFSLFYQTVYPGQDDSPLKENINDTKVLNLNHNQNIFSLRLSAINYDYPSSVIYSWKLDGFYEKWNRPGTENLIRYMNLDPGKYKLYVRAISSEDSHIIEERKLDIIIHPPFWKTAWAMIFYFLVFGIVCIVVLRYFLMKKERKISAEKINFFINTAHDIRTPLTLIKAPLDDLLEEESLSPEGENNLLMAIRSTNSLFRMISNLINFEKADIYSSKLFIAEYELYSFMEETIKEFKGYAEAKQIQLIFESNFRFLNVWFDKNKMDSILKNLISNALKYTPANGSVRIIAHSTPNNWSLEIKDTGIGIPANEQKKLFRMFFRGSNAVNSKVTGSGIGLLLTKKLVHNHKGSISVKSVENIGSSFKVTFKHGHKHFKHEYLGHPEQTSSPEQTDSRIIFRSQKSLPEIPTNPVAPKLLVVEDNDDLRAYLKQSLSEKYTVSLAANGQEALNVVKSLNPQLIISDIMMPVMRGDEMCIRLKNDIDTSHIPVILLTALSDKDSIISGLATKADKYLTKPFDIAILKADIANLLENRALLAKRFAELDLKEPECVNYSSDLDLKFMTKVKECIESNIENPNFNVDILCAALNMSRTSFYNKLKAVTEQAPADFIRTQRMNKAALLLKERKHSINSISDMTGFNDPKYFTEVFKKHFNMTPSQYMKENKQ